MFSSLFLSLSAVSVTYGQDEYVLLNNAAAPGQRMPAIGLGTGGYGPVKNGYNHYPECWMEIAGCGNYTIQAVKSWLSIGGRRLDAADSYDTQYSVGVAMAESGVPRESVFLLQKCGNWNAMFVSLFFVSLIAPISHSITSIASRHLRFQQGIPGHLESVRLSPYADECLICGHHP